MKSSTRNLVGQVVGYLGLIYVVWMATAYDWKTSKVIIAMFMWAVAYMLFTMLLAFFSEMHLAIKETIGYRRASRAVALTVIYEICNRMPMRKK